MKIACVMGFQSLWGEHLKCDLLDAETGPSCGGGEESTLRIAAGLAQKGHDVTCWWYGQPGWWRGAEFKSLRDPLSSALLEMEPDAILCWSTILPLQWAKKGAVRLFFQQLNDLWCPGNWDTVDCIVSPSRDHAQQLKNWGWKNKPWTVVHNGLDRELYDVGIGGSPALDAGTPRPKWKDRPLSVGYWSSPDRGLHHLLQAWPEIHKQVPEAKLNVFYEIERWIDSGASRALGSYGDRAKKMARDLLPQARADASITFHGQVTRKQLAKVQLQTRVHCYPYDPIEYCEGFGGAVNQGIAAGCHVLLGPHDAFPSLYEGAVTWLPADPWQMQRELVGITVKALTDEKWSTEVTNKAKITRFKYTWAKAVDEAQNAILRKGWEV